MKIKYMTEQLHKDDLYGLYKELGWIQLLKLEKARLYLAMENSQYVIYAYDGAKLVGTGRVLSDMALHTYLCGLGVLEKYRSRGIGTEINRQLVEYCEKNELKPRLLCEVSMVPYYEKLGFTKFTVGMRK